MRPCACPSPPQPYPIRRSGAIPVDELEELFTSAGLYESRTVVGQLAYDADADGNGALDYDEFATVLDKLR